MIFMLKNDASRQREVLDYAIMGRPAYPADTNSCDLVDRMIAFGLPMEDVFSGVYTSVKEGYAEAVYDPHALGGFVLRASALTYRGLVDIGFDTSGHIVRSLLDFTIINADEALTLWFFAAKDHHS
jgi:hypothetical protein